MAARKPALPCPPPDDRFWAKVDRGGAGGCWLWTGCTSKGYGRICRGGENFYTHRVTYVAAHGEHDPELVIDHLCRVRNCVNPDHLEVVSVGENIKRGEGPLAIKARAPECPHGHPYTPENTYRRSTGQRGCRTCKRRNSRAHKVRRRERRCLQFGPARIGRPPKIPQENAVQAALSMKAGV